MVTGAWIKWQLGNLVYKKVCSRFLVFSFAFDMNIKPSPFEYPLIFLHNQILNLLKI